MMTLSNKAQQDVDEAVNRYWRKQQQRDMQQFWETCASVAVILGFCIIAGSICALLFLH